MKERRKMRQREEGEEERERGRKSCLADQCPQCMPPSVASGYFREGGQLQFEY